MRSRKRAKPSYAVGYRRPPKATQFAKGKSGNPRGRPKGSRTVAAVLQEILEQKIAVIENGKTRRLPAFEVMLRRLVNDAMRNDSRALKMVLALQDRYGDSPETSPRLDEVLAEDKEILAKFMNGPLKNSSQPNKARKRNEGHVS